MKHNRKREREREQRKFDTYTPTHTDIDFKRNIKNFLMKISWLSIWLCLQFASRLFVNMTRPATSHLDIKPKKKRSELID